MLENAIVFVFTSTSKYAYVSYHRIYTEIRSYLLKMQTPKEGFRKIVLCTEQLLLGLKNYEYSYFKVYWLKVIKSR